MSHPAGIQKVSFDSLCKTDQKMLRAAKDALKYAYSPYGMFYVAAAVLAEGDRVFTGSNVGNAAAGPSICAERSALVRVNAEGFGDSCRAIAVVAKGHDFATSSVTSPCGICRQVISEFAARSGIKEDFRVIMATTDFEEVVVSTIGDLLPMAFGPSDLRSSPSPD